MSSTTDFERSYVTDAICDSGVIGSPICLEPGQYFHFESQPKWDYRAVVLYHGIATCGLGPCPQTLTYGGEMEVYRPGDSICISPGADDTTKIEKIVPNSQVPWDGKVYVCLGGVEDLLQAYRTPEEKPQP